MRILVILALIVAAGLLLTIVALQRPAQPEIAAVGTPQEAQESVPQEAVAASTPLPVAQATSVPAPQPQTAAYNATREACLALEQRLLSELDDAEEQLKDANHDYADAEETYDDALSAKYDDEAYLEQLRGERNDAREAQDAAENDYNLVLKRLSKTRSECGLFR